MNAAAVIVAAGEGRRLGNEISKPYVPLNGRPMLLWTLDRIVSARCIETIVVVAAAAELSRCEALLAQDSALRHRLIILQNGGATRQESVRRGLDRLAASAEIIMIHDGARPFVSPALIDRCVEAAYEQGAAVVGLPARDTIKIVSEERFVRSTLERNSLWEIQTPQAFRRAWIMAAHDWAEHENIAATDDATLVERMGRPVFVLEGERTNLKITVPEDLWLAETLIREGRVP
jgi:2-C-methyl-D-erythritol 4-phosphate cytidylyltransferase